MYTLSGLPNGTTIFSVVVSSKITNIVSAGNQVEAISLFEVTDTSHRLYITNEKSSVQIGSITFPFPAKLWTIEIDSNNLTLSTSKNNLEMFSMYPNPFNTTINFTEKVDEVLLYNLLGEVVLKREFIKKLTTKNLHTGIYFAHIKIGNTSTVKKIVKL